MSLMTKVFPHKDKKWGTEYMIDKGGLTHTEAKIEVAKLHKQGHRARIAPYEGKWATWIKIARHFVYIEGKKRIKT